MQGLIPTITVSAILAGFETLGLNTEVMLQALRVHRSQLDDPYSMVPSAIAERLWKLAFEQDAQPGLPVRTGMAAPFGAFGLLDHLVASTHTVGEGLYTLQVFFRLVSTKIKLEFENLPDGDWVWIVNDPPAPTDVISDQWTLALIVKRFKRLAAKFKVQQAYLSEPASAPERIYEEHFGVPVQRGQPQAGMKLASGSWRARISTADPTLHRTLRSLAERVEVKAFHKAPLAYALQMRLPDALRSGRYSTQQMAAQLGLSPRTFQRRLNEEQVTFTQVLDAYRQDEALKLLEQGDKSMAEIAYALGYNEQSSFNRAFKRWTGKTPKMWAKETERT